MLKSYKYRIYPSEAQKSTLAGYFGSCRFVYNLGLETKIAAYTSVRKNISCFDLMKQMKELKDSGLADWLKECPSQTLQYSLRNLDNAYTRFFKGGGFPKFKNKYSRQSIHFPQGVEINEKEIVFPKIKAIPFVKSRPLGIGKIKTVTLSKTSTNKYFVSIFVDNQNELPKKKSIKEQTTVGIDLGIKTLAVLSDGTEFENPKWFRKSKANLARQQRSLSRKQKGSKRRGKQKLVVATIHEKIRNQRNDYLQKITTQIITKFDTVVLEDLNVSGMVKNRSLSLAISEIGWYSFKQMLTYKAEWYGKNIITIGRFKPSSKICSTCGTINKELKLQHREWDCAKCGTHHDRDKNAAINIKNFGLRNRPATAKTSH